MDATIAGSRSGHTVLQLWWALHHITLDEHRARGHRAREVAEHAVTALRGIGWRASRRRHGFTVLLDAPPTQLVLRWGLATENGRSHIVCVPGVTPDVIDAFVADLQRAPRR